MARGNPVPVMGIWLRREGDYAVVLGEDIHGRSVELMREHIGGPFSHNISEHGIAAKFEGRDMSVRAPNDLDVA